MEPDYIAELAEELRILAIKAGMPFLAFLLGMVVEEARHAAAPSDAM